MTATTPRGLLTLCMIVKDEAHTLAKTLESAKGAIDHYSILDTGSTDGTQDLIRKTLSDVPGEVHEGPFVDFATTRNRALDLCQDVSEFTLSLDADDVLVGAERLREFLTSVRKLRGDGYNLRLKVREGSFVTARLFRSRARWRYVGVVHELLLPPGQGSYPADIRLIGGVHIDHFPGEVGAEKTRSRWERDIKLLSAELEKNPSDTRSCFYLGQTLKDLGRNLEAFRQYDRRVKMGGGFKEEIFFSKLCMARCARRAGLPWATCVDLWLKAHEEDPSRVEPLADLSCEHSGRDEHAQCVLYARRAMELPCPREGALFVENYDYLMAHHVGWHAYYLEGQDELGVRACKRAIELRPDACEADRRNLALYLKRKVKIHLRPDQVRAIRDAWGDD